MPARPAIALSKSIITRLYGLNADHGQVAEVVRDVSELMLAIRRDILLDLSREFVETHPELAATLEGRADAIDFALDASHD